MWLGGGFWDCGSLAFMECRCYTYLVEFEWDAAKAAANESKHGVGFMEAMT